MEKDPEKNSLELSKLSFDNLKKTNQDNQCCSKDFQPFLEYSPWHFFEASAQKFIKGCKKSLHFLAHSIREFRVLTSEIGIESQMFQTLSKSMSVASLILRAKKRVFNINSLGQSHGKPLYELLSRKRTYSKFPED